MQRFFYKIIFCVFTFGILQSASIAQVVINEYSASNLKQFQDTNGEFEDWVELYNTSASPVQLDGWFLSDKEDNPEKWSFPSVYTIDGNSFLRVWCSGRDTVLDGQIHTNFKLTQTKDNETLVLTEPSGTLVDMTSLELTLLGHSRAREMDGTGNWMVCTEPTLNDSNNEAPKFNGYTSEPIMNFDGGFYNDSLNVGIVSFEPNAIIRYNVTGKPVRSSDPIYSEPISVTSTQVVKARVFSLDSLTLPGKTTFNTYFINEDFTVPVISVACDTVIALANGDKPLRPIGSIEYFNTDKIRSAISYGEMNSHGQDSWINPQRSLDWISRDEMGYNSAIQEKIFAYSDRTEFQRLIFRCSGDDNYPAINNAAHEGSCHIRDEYVHQLALDGGMKVDVRANQRAVIFLNGQYWGLYTLRERPVDHDYTNEYYNQGKFELQYLLTWGGTWAEYGGQGAFNDWAALRNFILEEDMSDSSNYQVVKDNINLTSMIDYFITNLNVVASDWLNYNTGWWRGLNPQGNHKKWGFILWDDDATFDYYINYSGVPNTNPDAVPCDIDDISDYMDDFFNNDPIDPTECQSIISGASPYPADDSIFQLVILMDSWCCTDGWDGQCQDEYDGFVAGILPTPTQGDVGKHEKIFLKLQEENEEFRQLYYSRQADSQNTVFSCDNMLNTFDQMVAEILPEMPRQIQRWGGSMQEWETNIATMRAFIEERCSLLDDGMVECFDVTGPYELTLQVEPAGIGVGEIDINTLDIEEFPWVGNYYGGMENLIKAKSFIPEYEFLRWESSAGNVIFPDSSERRARIVLTQPDTLTAVFSLPVSTVELEKGFSFTAYPTIANQILTVKYELEETEDVSLSLYSVLGNKVTEFQEVKGRMASGSYQTTVYLKAKGLNQGLYFLNFRAGNTQGTIKITIVE